MINKPFVFLPVEITNRELDYKLNLARLFCQEGFAVIIGNPPFIRDDLKYKNYKGIFLEKGLNPDPGYYEFLKNKKIYCYDLSDEGLGKCVYNIDYAPCLDALSKMRKIFFWGIEQKNEFYKRCQSYETKEKMIAVGNPSFDLSLPKFKFMNNELKSKGLPNNFILVNMNFPSLFGMSSQQLLKSCPNMAPQTYESILKELQNETRESLVLLPWLDNIITSFPNETFVIRPHPCEVEKNYTRIFGKYKNVIISKEGNVNYVIASAKLVLHKDCSTALQAYLMDIPVISLGGKELNQDYVQWPLTFSLLPSNLEEAKEMIDKICNKDPSIKVLIMQLNEKAKSFINNHFSNLGNSTRVLVENILQDSQELIKNFKPYQIIDNRNYIKKIKLFFREKLWLHYKLPKASQLTLIKFRKKDVMKRLKLLEFCDSTGTSFKVTKIFPNTYKIEKI